MWSARAFANCLPRRRYLNTQKQMSVKTSAPMIAPHSVAARNPGASTSITRSPACAALFVPSTTESVIRLGNATSSATTTAMPAIHRRERRR